jgi:2-polyprenyl-3-methyl-5-hydroxy-6-metoxy-1,4-benzoquinol methylase
VLSASVHLYRRLRDACIEARLAVRRAHTDFKNSRAVTARNVARRNDRRAYERIFEDERLLREYLAPERISFYAEVARIVAEKKPRSVIDVGCGAGDLLRAVVDAAAPERLVGIDHAAAGIRRAKELVPAGEFHARNLYDLDLAENFDLVLCTEVLEHLTEPDRAMAVLMGLCAPAGEIVITVPDGAQDTWEGHRNFWSESELGEFLRGYGRAEVTRMDADSTSLFAVVRPKPRI